MTLHIVRAPLDDRRTVERFIRVPWYVNRVAYPNDKWVPPLLMDRRDYLNEKKNPFFEHANAALWIAVRDDKDVGRIAAVVDSDYESFHGERVGHFGMFESIDDQEVVDMLLERAREWLEQQGAVRMTGPMDLSMNYTCGVLVEGFDKRPGINMPYNPPYYADRLEKAGLAKAKDLFQWGIELENDMPERVVRIADRIKKREGITIRNFDFDNWDRDVETARTLMNEAWSENWGYVPMSQSEYAHIAKDLKMVLRPELGIIAEVDGEAVAFALTIMDVNDTLQKVDGKLFPFGAAKLAWDVLLNKDKIKRGRLILLGLKSEYRRRGLDSVLMVETFRNAQKLGITGGEIGWTLEDNDLVNRAIQNFGCERKFTYRIFERPLVDAPEAQAE